MDSPAEAVGDFIEVEMMELLRRFGVDIRELFIVIVFSARTIISRGAHLTHASTYPSERKRRHGKRGKSIFLFQTEDDLIGYLDDDDNMVLVIHRY